MQAVVFTHLIVNDKAAFGGTKPLDMWVEEQWGGLFHQFNSCQNIKLVYLFLSNAYQAKLVATRDREAERRANTASGQEDSLRTAIRTYLLRWKHAKKFVIVGLHELLELLDPMASLSWNSGGADLNRLFLGQGQQIFYDCPKVVEALIRIARRNTDPESPILRFDEDVSVTEDSVNHLIDEFRRQRRQSLYYFFSGNYRFHTSREERLLNDFSVRVHFLSHPKGATLDSYLQAANLPTDGSAFISQSSAVEQKLQGKGSDLFDLESDLAQDFLDLIAIYGANIRNQPISGAGLCIAPMAIVQLPPFANVATNIMWIDDALKHQLHLGIGDLQPNQICTVLQAPFQQNRHFKGVRLKDVLWGYTAYLPRLILGCLFYALMYNPLTMPHSGPFAASFAEYMRTRKIPTQQDREAWANAAANRLEELKDALCGHSSSNHPAWKPLVALAKNELTFDDSIHGPLVNSVVVDPKKEISTLCTTMNLSPRNAGTYIAEVVSDLHRYIELVELWPYIVRTIDFLVRNSPPNHWLRQPILL